MRWLLLLGIVAGCRGKAAPAPTFATAERTVEGCVAQVMATPRRDPVVSVGVGDKAVDVPLMTLDGTPTSVAALARDKPALFVTGSETCPVYQARKGKLRRLAERVGDHARVVLVYTTEAHPKRDPSPYTGEPWPTKASTLRQATSTEERLERARALGLGPDITVVVDPMDPGAADPFWCTFGPCPHCGFFVDTEGTIHAVHDWFDAPSMGQTMRAVMGQ